MPRPPRSQAFAKLGEVLSVVCREKPDGPPNLAQRDAAGIPKRRHPPSSGKSAWLAPIRE
jgi:hypothetical protein